VEKALVVIDYTYDFVADDGKLTCGKPGQALDGYIAHQIQVFLDRGDAVVFAIDVHEVEDAFHPETKLFPPHNLRGTAGRALYGQVGAVYDALVAGGATDAVRWLDKTRYSAFVGTDLEIFMRSHGIDEIHLVGVCTDICVLHTAVDAYNKGFHTVVHEQGVASFSEFGHAWALQHFSDVLGARVEASL